MKKTHLKANEYFYPSILVLFGLMTIFIGYYFLYSLPKYNTEKLSIEREKQKIDSENQKIELAKQEEDRKFRDEQEKTKNNRISNQKKLLDTCIANADEMKSETWDKNCAIIGYTDDAGKCIIGSQYIKIINAMLDKWKADKAECIERYPAISG